VKRFIDFTPWSVRLGLLVILLNLSGCQQHSPTSGGTLSEVYSQFDPEAEFAKLGFQVEPDTVGGALSPGELYGWRPFQGTLRISTGDSSCEGVAEAIRRSLEHVLHTECLDQLTQPPQRQPGKLLYGVLRYDSEGKRGHVYVWLFPDQSETKINYAILLREELLRCTKAQAAAGF
jgi:hypothetical protein